MAGFPSNNYFSDPIEHENSGLKWSEARWNPTSDHKSGKSVVVQVSCTAPS